MGNDQCDCVWWVRRVVNGVGGVTQSTPDKYHCTQLNLK